MSLRLLRKSFSKLFTILITLSWWVASVPRIVVDKTNTNNLIVLSNQNFHSIDSGNWVIVFSKYTAAHCRENSDCKIGLIQVNTLENARLASRFQPQDYSEVIHYEKGNISSKYGNRKIIPSVSLSTALDTLVFFNIKNFQARFFSLHGIQSAYTEMKDLVVDVMEDMIIEVFY